MSQYFPKTFRSFRGNINIKVDLSNYATKTDLKNVTHIDTSSFALKTNLANLKAEVDKLDIDKLASDPVDLIWFGDHVRISKYKNIFPKGYTPNWSEEIFVVNEIKNTVSCTYVVSDLNGEKITES